MQYIKLIFAAILIEIMSCFGYPEEHSNQKEQSQDNLYLQEQIMILDQANHNRYNDGQWNIKEVIYLLPEKQKAIEILSENFNTVNL